MGAQPASGGNMEACPVLYHYTCLFHLPSIMNSGILNTTESNAFNKNARDVVWLTSSLFPDNHGLLYDPNMPDDLNKTRIRITVRREPFMIPWVDWCRRVGVNEDIKRCIIESANADETHLTWVVSEKPISRSLWLKVEDLWTRQVYRIRPIAKS